MAVALLSAKLHLLQLFTLREQQSKSRHSSGSVEESRASISKSGSVDSGQTGEGEQQSAAQAHPKVGLLEAIDTCI